MNSSLLFFSTVVRVHFFKGERPTLLRAMDGDKLKERWRGIGNVLPFSCCGWESTTRSCSTGSHDPCPFFGPADCSGIVSFGVGCLTKSTPISNDMSGTASRNCWLFFGLRDVLWFRNALRRLASGSKSFKILSSSTIVFSMKSVLYKKENVYKFCTMFPYKFNRESMFVDFFSILNLQERVRQSTYILYVALLN